MPENGLKTHNQVNNPLEGGEYDIEASVKELTGSPETKEAIGKIGDETRSQITDVVSDINITSEQVKKGRETSLKTAPAPHPDTLKKKERKQTTGVQNIPPAPHPDTLKSQKTLSTKEELEKAIKESEFPPPPPPRAEAELNVETTEVPTPQEEQGTETVDVAPPMLRGYKRKKKKPETQKEAPKPKQKLSERFNFSKKTSILSDTEKDIIDKLMTAIKQGEKDLQNKVDEIIEKTPQAPEDKERLKKITLGITHLLKNTKKEKERDEILKRKIEEITSSNGNKEYLLITETPEQIGEGGIGIIYAGHYRLTKEGIEPIIIKKVKNLLTNPRYARIAAQEALIHKIIEDNQGKESGLPKQYYADEDMIITENVRPQAGDDSLDSKKLKLTPGEYKKLIAQAMQTCYKELHKIGIIHRDIKPANIVQKTTKTGEKIGILIDFGLSEYVREDEKYGKDVISETLKKTDSISGTPGFFDPETCFNYNEEGKYVNEKTFEEKKSHTLRPETDQFAFAVTILEKVFGFSMKKYREDNNIATGGFALALIANFQDYRKRLMEEIQINVEDDRLRDLLNISIMRINAQRHTAAANYENKYGSPPNMKELANVLSNLVI